MLNFSEFLTSFQEANSIQTKETNIQEVDQDINYWSNLANHDQSDKVTIDKERVKQTLRNIVTYYLGEGQEVDGIDYSEYSKYFSENHPENYLFNHLINKLDPDDVRSVPEFMVQMILFFDQVSKLSNEDKKRILGEFPMSKKDDYVCIRGIKERLTIASSKLKSPQVEIAIGHVTQGANKLFKFLHEGIEIHSSAALSYMICGSTNDTYWHKIPERVPASEAWKFVREFPHEVSRQFKESDNFKALRKIRESYDEFMNKFKDRDDKTVDLSLSEENDDKKFLDHTVYVTFFLNQLNLNADDLTEKFFNKKTGEFLFDKNGETLLEVEIKKLEKLYEEIDLHQQLDFSKSENEERLIIVDQVAIQKENDLSNYDLYDAKFPQKIAEILLDKESDPYQKHLAVQALFIMSEHFQGNSKVNLIKALHLIGLERVTEEDLNGFSGDEKEKKRVEIAIIKSKEVLNELLQDQNVFDSTKKLINQSFNKKIKVEHEYLDLVDRLLEGYKYYEIVKDSISVDDIINLGCPAELLSRKNIPDVITRILKERNPHHLQEILKAIFYNPKRNQILQTYFSYQSNDPKIIENKQFICLDMAYEALRTNDLDLLKFLIDNAERTKMFGEDVHTIENYILGNIVYKEIFWNKETMQYLFDRLKDGRKFINPENIKSLLLPNNEESKGFLTSLIIDGKKDIILDLFASVDPNSLRYLLSSKSSQVSEGYGIPVSYNIFTVLINKFDYKFVEQLIQGLEDKFGKQFIVDLMSEKMYSGDYAIVNDQGERVVPFIGGSSLNFAVINGNLNLVNLILNKVSEFNGNQGVSKIINNKLNFGQTAIFDAILSGNKEIAQTLFERSINIYPTLEQSYLKYNFLCKNNNNDTILHLLPSTGNVEMVNFVFENLDKIDDQEAVKELLRSKNNNNLSILDAASYSRNQEMFGLLLQRIDDVDLENILRENQNPLSIISNSTSEDSDLSFEVFMIEELSKRIPKEEFDELMENFAQRLIDRAVRGDNTNFLEYFINKFNSNSNLNHLNNSILGAIEGKKLNSLKFIISKSEKMFLQDLKEIMGMGAFGEVNLYSDDNFDNIIFPTLEKLERCNRRGLSDKQIELAKRARNDSIEKVFVNLLSRSDFDKIERIKRSSKIEFSNEYNDNYFESFLDLDIPVLGRRWKIIIKNILQDEHQVPNDKKQETIAYIVDKIDMQSSSNGEKADLLHLLIKNGERNNSFDLIPSVMNKIGKKNLREVLETNIKIKNKQNPTILKVLSETKQDVQDKVVNQLIQFMGNDLDVQFVQTLLDSGVKISEKGIRNIEESKSEDKDKILFLISNHQKNSEEVDNKINSEVLQGPENKKEIQAKGTLKEVVLDRVTRGESVVEDDIRTEEELDSNSNTQTQPNNSTQILTFEQLMAQFEEINQAIKKEGNTR